jgi:hypothetical protein
VSTAVARSSNGQLPDSSAFGEPSIYPIEQNHGKLTYLSFKHTEGSPLAARPDWVEKSFISMEGIA